VGKPALQIDDLSKHERLELIERLWESLGGDDELPIPAEQRAELAARERALEAGSLKMISVEDVLVAIRNRRA